MAGKPLTFGVIGVDHNHIFAMVAGMVEAGARFKGWWTKDDPVHFAARTMINAGAPFKEFFDEDKAATATDANYAATRQKDSFPGVPRVADRRQLIEDPEIDVILLAPLHTDRAGFAIEAMKHGKDIMCDKPGATTLEEMAALRRTVAETGRIWSVDWSERYHVPAMIKAGQLVKEGAIGRVVQTLGLGPHRPMPTERPHWWFHAKEHGGIMCYLASHQIDHFLFYTGSTTASVMSSTLGNFRYPQWPEVEDFGDLILHGDGGVGYIRVDWYTPDDKAHPGDNRLLIAGTEGSIEVRKYTDIGGRPGQNHLFIETNGRSEHIDCSDVKLPYFTEFCDDVRNRTEIAASQEHSFLVNELAIMAGTRAHRLGNLAR